MSQCVGWALTAELTIQRTPRDGRWAPSQNQRAKSWLKAIKAFPLFLHVVITEVIQYNIAGCNLVLYASVHVLISKRYLTIKTGNTGELCRNKKTDSYHRQRIREYYLTLQQHWKGNRNIIHCSVTGRGHEGQRR